MPPRAPDRLLAPPAGARLSQIETDWRIVRALADPDRASRRAGWERLVETYRPAMATYVHWRLRASGLSDPTRDDVDEVLQGFVAWAMESGILGEADRERGPFRAWLQILLKRYVYRWLRARRRGVAPGGRAGVPIEEVADDALPAAPDATDADAEAFERGWGVRLVALALERLDARHPPYAAVIRDLLAAAEAGAKPPPIANRHLRFHARKAFRACFEQALRETVDSDAAVPAEWATLARWLP